MRTGPYPVVYQRGSSSKSVKIDGWLFIGRGSAILRDRDTPTGTELARSMWNVEADQRFFADQDWLDLSKGIRVMWRGEEVAPAKRAKTLGARPGARLLHPVSTASSSICFTQPSSPSIADSNTNVYLAHDRVAPFTWPCFVA